MAGVRVAESSVPLTVLPGGCPLGEIHTCTGLRKFLRNLQNGTLYLWKLLVSEVFRKLYENRKKLERIRNKFC